jgi:hypothetical protein
LGYSPLKAAAARKGPGRGVGTPPGLCNDRPLSKAERCIGTLADISRRLGKRHLRALSPSDERDQLRDDWTTNQPTLVYPYAAPRESGQRSPTGTSGMRPTLDLAYRCGAGCLPKLKMVGSHVGSQPPGPSQTIADAAERAQAWWDSSKRAACDS